MIKYFINIAYKAESKYYDTLYEDIYKEYGTKTINIIISSGNEYQEDISAHIQNIYLKKNNIIKYLQKLGKNKVYINTYKEELTVFTTSLKKKLGQAFTIYYKAFNDKSLQRSYIQKKYPEIIPHFAQYKQDQLLSYTGPFPIVIKPATGAESFGVRIISNTDELQKYISEIDNLNSTLKLDKRLNNKKFLIEEFIQGEMGTVTYFVDGKGKISELYPIKVMTFYDLGVQDFSLYMRTMRKDIDKLNHSRIKDMIQKTVKSIKIKNTFIHQEFKIDKQGNPKVIEINVRFGGFRPELYKKALGLNLPKLVFGKKQKLEVNSMTNYALFTIYPKENNKTLSAFNIETIQKIKSLPSFKKINLSQKFINQKVGYSGFGFAKLGSITLQNDNTQQFEQDVEFVNKIYFKLLELR